MNIRPENIIVNSCEYTPVYLIPNPGVTQAGSYYLTSSAQDVQVQKPVSDNLKRFYENSGNLDSGVLISPKPRILKKQTTNVVGNNLKLASFLLPKNEPQPQVSISSNVNLPQKTTILTPVTNVLLKPAVNTINNNKTDICMNTNEVHTPQPPLIEVDRKIVRVGTIPSKSKIMFPKVPPKLLPKEPLPPPPPAVTGPSTASVQLIKFGQTYHSLNQLSKEQIHIVNKALKMFSGAEQPKEPAYEPETKPKFIYKLVPAKDLSLSDRRLLAKKRADIRKHPIKKVDKKEVKQEPKNEPEADVDEFLAQELPAPKVTRSGRTVKLSRHIRRAESPQKPKKKITPNTVQCFQCCSEFTSLYRLQRHYENFPTHYPERVHSNLFHCLQAILKGCHNNQAFMFVQQLEQLIDKLRTLLPCLLKKMDGIEGSPCTVTDQIGRLFGMLPGKYNLNMDALNCVKDTEGHCIHNPHPPKTEPTHIRMSDDSQTITLQPLPDIDDCARINSVDKWPTISKRILNKKKIAAENLKAKRIRLASENGEAIELTIDDVNYEPQKAATVILAEINKESVLSENLEDSAKKSPKPSQAINNNEPVVHDLTQSTSSEQILTAPVKYYSTHFDIRSSPIKLPSNLVKKFQLKPEEASTEVQILRPCNDQDNVDNGHQDIENHENASNGVTQNENSLSHDGSFINHMFPDNELQKEVLYELNQLSFPSNIFDSPLTKALKEVTHFDQSLEKQSLFDPSLIDSSSNQSSSANMIEPTLLLKDKVDGYFEPSAIRVKTEKDKVDGYFEPSAIRVKTEKANGISKSALTHVKERSKILFEVQTDNYVPEQMNDQSQKPHSLFSGTDKPISRLFESSAIRPTNGIMRSQSNCSGIFQSGIKHSKDDTLISSSFIDDKSNDMMVPTTMNNEPSAIEKPSSIIDSNLMDEKSLSDLNDVRLLNNQGQSVLNFLEALGPDCLSYPETDIRNNTEDFQLDLFSFSST